MMDILRGGCSMAFTREDLQRSIDSTAAPAFVVGGEGRILDWNSAAEAVLGHSKKTVLARPCQVVINGRDVFGNPICRSDCPVRCRARRGQAVQCFRMHAQAAAGHYVEVECTSLCVRNEEGDEVIIHLLRTMPGRPDRLPNLGGKAVGPAETADLDRLTDREAEVLRRLAQGQGTRQLAEELSISVATVRSHVESILQKLSVHSRLEAVVVALRKGLI